METMNRTENLRRPAVSLSMIGLLLLLLASACGGTSTSEPAKASVVAPAPEPARFITLGDIDPDDPVSKIERFTPLANYLAEHLKEYGIETGRVVIARDMDEMGALMKAGTVDVYFDSAFPTILVQGLSGSEVVLRRWKDADPTYWSTYVVLRGNGVETVEDFVGKVIAFEERFSTSGFVLPAGTLIQRGFSLREVRSPQEEVAPDEIGYFFTQDEENTMELVLQGLVAGGGVSNQDYAELPQELKDKLVALDRTVEVPRQLVSVRPGLDRELVDRVTELLASLDGTDEGRDILEGIKKTKKFDRLPADSETKLAELRRLMDLLGQ